VTGIDRVINRTLTYGVLAVAIGVAYVYGVSNIDAWFGLDSDWLAPPQVAAAGLIAVVFHPVRVGLEALADRIVYGRRLRPGTAVARIVALGGTTGAGAESLRELARIVATGLGTGSAAVRLRLSDGSSAVYAWPETARYDTPGTSGASDASGSAGATDSAGTSDISDTSDTTDSADTSPPAGASAEPAGDRGMTSFPVSYRGEVVGAIEVPAGPGRPGAPRRRAMREKLVAGAGVVLHNASLDIELEHQVRVAEERAAEIRTSRWRIVAAQDSERRELERDLHDGAQPGLTAVRLALGLVTHLANAGRTEAAQKALGDLCTQIDNAAAVLKHTLRGLDPEALQRSGIAAAIKELTEELGVGDHARIDDRTDGLRLRPDLEATAYFCCAEAVQNAAKHSPGAQLSVRLEHDEPNGTLAFEITDDGPGFDVAAHAGGAGSGLQNMADRAATAGGAVVIASHPGGTTVSGWIPAVRP
jgi:signal transduction histidine kinase